MNLDKVTRVEVIDYTKTLEEGGGRVIVKYDVGVALDLQDDDRTLKIFIDNPKDAERIRKQLENN